MVIFNSYVKLPEGIKNYVQITSPFWQCFVRLYPFFKISQHRLASHCLGTNRSPNPSLFIQITSHYIYIYTLYPHWDLIKSLNPSTFCATSHQHSTEHAPWICRRSVAWRSWLRLRGAWETKLAEPCFLGTLDGCLLQQLTGGQHPALYRVSTILLVQDFASIHSGIRVV
jgi:hypothetical protein